MTKEQLYSILDSNSKVNRTNMIIVLVFSALFLISGICFLLFLENDGPLVGAIFGGMGLLFGTIGAVSLISKSAEKEAARIKDILNTNPTQLVWSYVFKQNNRGAVSISVVMNFRDGKTFQVSENAIPGKDSNGFMLALRNINPEMHVGYSEELEYKFKKRTL